MNANGDEAVGSAVKKPLSTAELDSLIGRLTNAVKHHSNCSGKTKSDEWCDCDAVACLDDTIAALRASTQNPSPAIELARLACEQGASFDVTYEADGAVRISLYPQAHQPQVEQVLHFEGTLGPEQYQSLKDSLARDINDRRLRQG